MLLVNLFAGPGTGKSTTMADVFAKLKWAGVNCEMAPEFAKEKVWEESFGILDNQIYIFGKQLHAIKRVENKVDVVITDSPLLFSTIYGRDECTEFHALVKKVALDFNRMNILLKRIKPFNPAGRMQDEDSAKALDEEILQMLNDQGERYIEMDGCPRSSEKIFRLAMATLGRSLPGEQS
jgi:nicotinamide riboside kinase